MNLPAETSVLIIGAGPAGLTLANLLGAEGVDTVLVERNPGCVPEPRAVALDGESLCTLQAVGLADTVLANMKQGFVADYINGDGDCLFTTDLTSRPYGFCLQNTFDQPTLERQLQAGLDRFDCVTIRHGMELLEFEQDDNGVSASLRDADGNSDQLRADYLVGCDGGRSSVRRDLGIDMLGDRLPQKWLVVDTVDTYLSGEPQCRFFCDPARPAMTILRPGGERRWEWMLVGDETEQEMLDDARIRDLLAEHTDPSQVEVYRKCVYGFSAVVAERFSDGRVFLAGDAAHMTPPFAGQGLNAGVRDVRNLSWKLARVLDGSMPATLLDSYHFERRDAAKEMVDMAVMLGDQIQPVDQDAARERDHFFAQLNTDPVAAAAFARDIIAPLHDIRLKQGWFDGAAPGGRMLPNPPLDERTGGGFCALLAGIDEVPAALQAHPLWRALSPRVLAQQSANAELEGGGGPGITLVRPDRFILARVAPDETGLAVLDGLQDALAGHRA
jgi:3-(3-hydroxy-phenyl)propionate hydroxylase